MLAVREGRDDLARQALQRQQEYGERAQALYETWQRQATETERLKESLRQLNSKIEEARRKKNLLIAKQKRAEAQKRIHETMTGLSDRSAFEAFDRMAQRIEQSERLALASAEVTEELGSDHLEKEFKQLEVNDTADARLIEMKRKMGLLPPADQPESAGELPANGQEQRRIGSTAGGTVKDAELIEEFEELERREKEA